MKQPAWRLVATITALIATVVVFSYYFATHPGVGKQLGRMSTVGLIELFILYGISIIALTLVTLASLRMCKVQLQPKEGMLLTGYSSIINFFGPLQSGPAFRALYLKQRHGLQLRKYTSATFMYYMFYAAFNALFLLVGLVKWWLMPIAVLGSASLFGLSKTRLGKIHLARLDLKAWYGLALATFFQVSIYAVIYYIELKSIMPSVHVLQAISYTGAANFALFVSLTPGAVGFRETFLIFSQHIHHISNTTIVAANIIDRAIYVVVLLVVAAVIFATHARSRLQLK